MFISLTRICHQTPILILCCCQSSCIQLYRRCSGLHIEKAEYKMKAAVRQKDEELTIKLKCLIGVLMTDRGLICFWRRISLGQAARNARFGFCTDDGCRVGCSYSQEIIKLPYICSYTPVSSSCLFRKAAGVLRSCFSGNGAPQIL